MNQYPHDEEEINRKAQALYERSLREDAMYMSIWRENVEDMLNDPIPPAGDEMTQSIEIYRAFEQQHQQTIARKEQLMRLAKMIVAGKFKYPPAEDLPPTLGDI